MPLTAWTVNEEMKKDNFLSSFTISDVKDVAASAATASGCMMLFRVFAELWR